MYPVPPPGLITTGGELAVTGFSVGLIGFCAVVLIFVGLVIVRAATVRLDPDAGR